MKRVKQSILNSFKQQPQTIRQNNDLNADKQGLQLNQEQIFLEHRLFLDNYKKQKQKNKKTQQFNCLLDQLRVQQKQQIQLSSIKDLQLEEHNKNVKCIKQKMFEIQKKLQMQMLASQNNDTSVFKIFTNRVDHKKDINRISKQRSFIKSQTSNCFVYQQPKISSPMKIPSLQKNFTQAVGEQELKRQAKLFCERVEKQRQKIWGNHIIARRLEEKKRNIEERKEQQQFKLKRQLKILDKYNNLDKQHFENSQVLEKELSCTGNNSKKDFRISKDKQVLKKYLTEDKMRQRSLSYQKEQSQERNIRIRSRTEAVNVIEEKKESERQVKSIAPRKNKLKKMFMNNLPDNPPNQSLSQINVRLNKNKNNRRYNLVKSQNNAQQYRSEYEQSSDCSSPLPRLRVKQSDVIISTQSEVSD